MNTKNLFLATFTLLLTLFASSRPVFATEVWKAEYWNNPNLVGDPVLVRNESGLNNDWGDGSPDSSIDTDNFSAAWSTRTYFNEGTYRFTATVDDGMRLFVDGNEVINVWYDSQQHDVSVDVYMSAGEHNLAMLYFEASGKAVAKLSWTQVSTGNTSGASGSWTAEYFNNKELRGSPVRTQTESKIDYSWQGSPAADVNADAFSVRWKTSTSFDAGTYRFTVRADDGARLWVNGKQILNQWVEQPATTFSADIVLPAGTHPVQMEYFDHGGSAVAELSWHKIADAAAGQTASVSTAPSYPNWKAEYFNNRYLSGSPVLTRNDSAIDFEWGSSSPVPNVVNHDHFSVRWTRTVNLAAGTYKFKVNADDGVRVWVNDKLVLDQWTITNNAPLYATAQVAGGATTVRVEMFEYDGLASILLDWDAVNGRRTTSASSAAPVVPTAAEGFATLKNARVLTLRSGPGISFEPAGYILRSDTVQLVGRDSVSFWINVKLPDGTVGWASRKYLSSPTAFNSLPIVQSDS